MNKPFILGVNGSPHTDGIAADLLGSVLRSAKKEGAETMTVNLYALKMIPTEG